MTLVAVVTVAVVTVTMAAMVMENGPEQGARSGVAPLTHAHGVKPLVHMTSITSSSPLPAPVAP